MTEVFTKMYEITYDMLDFRRLVRPASLIYFAQEAATLHGEALGMGYLAMKEKGFFWMVTRQRVVPSRPVREDETLSVSTWIRQVKGAGFYRDFEFMSGHEKVAEASSLWVIADGETHRVMRSTVLDLSDVKIRKTGEIRLDALPAPVPSGLPMSRTVCYSDLDTNGHLNNVRAADILCDGAMLHEGKDLFVSDFQINYIRECWPGECLSLYKAENPCVVSAVGEDGAARLSGQFSFSPLPGK